MFDRDECERLASADQPALQQLFIVKFALAGGIPPPPLWKQFKLHPHSLALPHHQHAFIVQYLVDAVICARGSGLAAQQIAGFVTVCHHALIQMKPKQAINSSLNPQSQSPAKKLLAGFRPHQVRKLETFLATYTRLK